MKKLLLFFVLTLSFQTINAQLFYNENCSSLTVGNVGTDVTGTTPGQGGWLTYVAATGLNTDFQVVNTGGLYGNAFQITGSATATNTRWLFKNNLQSLWAARTAGNNILEVEFDYFTGPTTTSTNSFRVYLYSDETTSKAIAGMGCSKNAIVSTVNYVNNVTGYSYYDNAGTLGFYGFGMATAAPYQVTFPINTWIRIGFSYNKTDGKVVWKGPGINGFIQGAAPGLDVKELDILGVAGTANAVSSTGMLDNFLVRASATDTLLQNDTFDLATTNFSVSPNPANDFITVSNSENIFVNAISITDLNGRVVKQNSFSNLSNVQVNVSDLSSGVYMLNISSDKGSVTKKIIKN